MKLCKPRLTHVKFHTQFHAHNKNLVKKPKPIKNETSRTQIETNKADLVSAKFSSSRDAKPRQCSHPYSLCEARLFCEPWRPWTVLDLRWRWYLRVWVAIHFPLRRPQRRRIWVLGIRWFGPAYSIWCDPLFLLFSGFGKLSQSLTRCEWVERVWFCSGEKILRG